MMTQLEHYLAAWALDDPQPLAQTPTSHVYTVLHQRERVVLKLLTELGIADEANGGLALRHWDGRGAVRLLRHADDAHLLEYASGEPLAAQVERGEDDRASTIIAEVLNQLHATTATPPAGLKPLRTWFRSLFNRAATDEAAGVDSLAVRGARVAGALLEQPQEVRALHGDIHHGNIRWREGRGWLAFDPKGLIGERTYDAANTLCNPYPHTGLVHDETRLLRQAAILAESLNVERGRLLAFTYAYNCLSVSWALDDGSDAGWWLRLAEIIEPHVTL